MTPEADASRLHRVSFFATHRDGAMERDPSLESLDDLIRELDIDDPEHPDVAVQHETGWSLSAFASGLVVWENVEGGPEQRVNGVSRDDLRLLFRGVATGEVEEVQREISRLDSASR
jgi:hypothetical protein